MCAGGAAGWQAGKLGPRCALNMLCWRCQIQAVALQARVGALEAELSDAARLADVLAGQLRQALQVGASSFWAMAGCRWELSKEGREDLLF